MNLNGIWAIYRFEMARFGRTFWTSLLVPVITTSLYFVVFGSAIGSQMKQVSGVLSRNRRKFRQPINVACPSPGRCR